MPEQQPPPATTPTVIDPATVPMRRGTRVYPDKVKHLFEGRVKQALGDAVGLENFGVNLVRLEPGAWSSLRHWHLRQDEFVYILEGQPTLVTDAGECVLVPAMAAGFPAGRADGHHLINKTDKPVLYLEIGDRTQDDVVHYPDHNVIVQRPTGRS